MLLDTYTKLAEVPDDSTAAEKAIALLWAMCCCYLNNTYAPIDREREILHIGKKIDELYRSPNAHFAEELLYVHKRFYEFVDAGATTDLTPQFLDVLGDRDLLGLIDMGAPQDEYSPEVLPIIVWLMLHPECQLDELIVAIKKVFDVMFDSSAAHITAEQYGGVAQTLSIVWRLWYLRWEKEQWETEFLADAAECLKEVKDAADDHRRINYSRDALGWLVQHYPEKLLSWIREEQLRPEDLTFAAELTGSIPVELGSQDVLVSLLQHPEALVREGAVLGLWRQEPLPENILAMLHGLAAHDNSDAVRKTVFDVLEHHENQETDKPVIGERHKSKDR